MDKYGKIYFWEGVHWSIQYSQRWRRDYAVARCPKQKCNSRLKDNSGDFGPPYNYTCTYCDFEISLKQKIEELGAHLLEKQRYKNAEIINLDGELIRVLREEKKDDDYWIDTKISKNKKGELQLMVLAGSRKTKEKIQLFLDPANERLAFDQNNVHPTKIFSKVVATFKNSKSEIHSENDK